MVRSIFTVTLLAAAALGLAALTAAPADAGSTRKTSKTVVTEDGVHPKSKYYRGPRVKGFVARKGGYSYSNADSINTYGDSRSLFGSASSLRDPSLDRQTNSGPFDHGFFFDSGISPRGGNSPYMN